MVALQGLEVIDVTWTFPDLISPLLFIIESKSIVNWPFISRLNICKYVILSSICYSYRLSNLLCSQPYESKMHCCIMIIYIIIYNIMCHYVSGNLYSSYVPTCSIYVPSLMSSSCSSCMHLYYI